MFLSERRFFHFRISYSLLWLLSVVDMGSRRRRVLEYVTICQKMPTSLDGRHPVISNVHKVGFDRPSTPEGSRDCFYEDYPRFPRNAAKYAIRFFILPPGTSCSSPGLTSYSGASVLPPPFHPSNANFSGRSLDPPSRGGRSHAVDLRVLYGNSR